MNQRVKRSMELYQKALQLIPGGTQLVSRRPTRYANGVSPVFASRAKGARFWDVDGNEYIDWVSGIGAIILGYCDPIVDDAVREQMASGTMYSINHELEVELAEELVRTVPCAEMVRYTKCGGEACAVAVRIARGATGRDKVLFCGYHGWHDWYLAANLSAEANLNTHLFPGIEPTGVPRALEGPAGRMFISSTYWSDTIGLRAALTTIREVRRRDIPVYLNRLGTDLKNRLNEAARQTGLNVTCGGLSVHPALRFQVEDPALQS